MQHHVVVTGLERKHVTEDYLRRVFKGRETCKVRDYYIDLYVGPPRYRFGKSETSTFCNDKKTSY